MLTIQAAKIADRRLGRLLKRFDEAGIPVAGRSNRFCTLLARRSTPA